jgi:biotin-(acetyl-CoA carboxylase) ligase
MGVNLLSAPTVDSYAAQPATALSEHIAPAPYATWCRALVASFVLSLTASLADSDSALESWRRSLIHAIGDTITVRTASSEVQTGTFNGLTQEGFLRLRQGDDERVITGGDVVERG